MFFFDFLWRFISSMIQIFSFGKNTILKSIHIKSNTGSTCSVTLDPKLDIKNVKEIIAPQLGLQPEEIKIIFAGKELLDSTVIEECDLGEQSILHAVKITGRRKHVNPAKPLCETLEELELTDGGSWSQSSPEQNDWVIPHQDKQLAHFYVFCANPCKGLKTGKLRVRCSSCKNGAFTVDNDPQSWVDVLEPGRITGTCHNTDCNELFAELYLKCSEHSSQGELDQAVPLYLIKTNSKDIPCLACTDISNPILVFPCGVGHVTCLDCFRNYCVSRLRDRQFFSHPDYGYTLPCPAGCVDSFIQEIHHFRLLSVAQYDQYQRFGTEEFILQAGGVLCPQPGCGAGILVDKDCTRVQCLHGCGYVFCAKCLQGYHLGDCLDGANSSSVVGGCEYAVDPLRADRARWDEASSVTIKVLTKPCPKCRTSTERDGGCMHMVCTRANCGYHWCWVCQGPWERECMANHWFG